jgi:hypothetical protein
MFTRPSRLTVLGLAGASGFALLAASSPSHVALTASAMARSASLTLGHAGSTAAAAPHAAVAKQPAPSTGAPSSPSASAVLHVAANLANSATPSTVTCVNNPTTDTAALQAALNAGGAVSIHAGTCALNAKLPVNHATTISGAGANATFLVQHTSHTGIFNVKVQHVTIENLNLDTATANPVSYGSSGGTYAPGVIFSAQSFTSVLNVTAEVGDGFGMRITGTSPCSAYPTVGTVVQNVNVTNTGSGGRAAIDIDCTNGAQIRNITIHGQYIAFYLDENVTLSGETYSSQAFMGLCHEPWYVTGPSANITIDNVFGGGRGISTGTVTNLNVTGQTRTRSC